MDYTLLELILIYGIGFLTPFVWQWVFVRKITHPELKRKAKFFIGLLFLTSVFNLAYSWYYGFNAIENVVGFEKILDTSTSFIGFASMIMIVYFSTVDASRKRRIQNK